MKKKSKGQAAFVVGEFCYHSRVLIVILISSAMSEYAKSCPIFFFLSHSGKPRQEILQTESRKYSSGRHEKTVSNTLLKESGDNSADDYSCGSSAYTMDDMESSQASTVQKNHEARHSPDTDQVNIHHVKCLSGHSLETDQVAVSREDGGAGDIDWVSDLQERHASAISSRLNSSANSSSTSTWSIRRTSVSSESSMCSPVQLPHLFPRLRVPAHHPASSPAKSESADDVGLTLVS